MNKELIEALDLLEKEKNISKETLLEAIENSLLTACKNHFGKADNVKVNINPQTGDFDLNKMCIRDRQLPQQPGTAEAFLCGLSLSAGSWRTDPGYWKRGRPGCSGIYG